jgi:hypothetical protein
LKRIVFTGAAVAALFTAGIPAAAMAAPPAHQTKKKTATTKTVTTHVSCKLSLTTVAAPGSSGVTAGSTSGANFGNSTCSSSRPGVARQMFTIDTAGDMNGKVQQWFATGSVYGTFQLTAASLTGPPTATSFGKAKYTGTVKLTGASGMMKGISGMGTMACDTPDSLHFTCIEKLTLSQQVTATATSSKSKKKS